ncbi:hypothetical protein PHSY_000330 [Pseudozyma hubeiensis SY62]|uniref:Uncharacterized protein n=1 Tax=Pseudozyma hubeiensis (strain SY62) TaxID=1305764 RepID=R9NW89_PSEHS|nr:hypothetical protein PHSY_000330 [Pseudozyma hubeiensis SY62]GAC92774.1 hypothetical protein PHSY_000330 [Pseudozyma hubeiensis SY62]
MFRSITSTALRTATARRTPLALRPLSTSRSVNNAEASPPSASQQEEITAGEQKIRSILTSKFNPSILKVQDVSGEFASNSSCGCSVETDIRVGGFDRRMRKLLRNPTEFERVQGFVYSQSASNGQRAVEGCYQGYPRFAVENHGRRLAMPNSTRANRKARDAAHPISVRACMCERKKRPLLKGVVHVLNEWQHRV